MALSRVSSQESTIKNSPPPPPHTDLHFLELRSPSGHWESEGRGRAHVLESTCVGTLKKRVRSTTSYPQRSGALQNGVYGSRLGSLTNVFFFYSGKLAVSW